MYGDGCCGKVVVGCACLRDKRQYVLRLAESDVTGADAFYVADFSCGM